MLPNRKNTGYLGNPKLRDFGQHVEYTVEQEEEIIRCRKDYIYFIENYVQIVTQDQGRIKMKLYDIQKKVLDTYHTQNRCVIRASRQTGKTTTSVAYMLWYILFAPSTHEKFVAILANKESTAFEILHKLKTAYLNLPIWLQQGIQPGGWNKSSIHLENNSRVQAASTASSGIRGYTISLLFLDEFAHVPNNIAMDFVASVFPTVSAGQTSKIIIASTPKGMNHFYKLWTDSIEGYGAFTPLDVSWRDIPGRDEKWAAQMKKELGEELFFQEVECEFIGSAGTLISGPALKRQVYHQPIKFVQSIPQLKLYAEPKKAHIYFLLADVSRGKGIDYSAFVVVDASESPFQVVAAYKDNLVSPLAYPDIIRKVAKAFNNAHVMIEVNDNGQEVANILFTDMDYDNIIGTAKKGPKVMATFGPTHGGDIGFKTSKSTKRLGCALLKDLIENDKLSVNDYDIIFELSTFIQKRDTYMADDGFNDDLVMSLVFFAWLTNQQLFRDLTDLNIRDKLFAQRAKEIEEDAEPAPIVAGHMDMDRQEVIIEKDTVWTAADSMSNPHKWGRF